MIILPSGASVTNFCDYMDNINNHEYADKNLFQLMIKSKYTIIMR